MPYEATSIGPFGLLPLTVMPHGLRLVADSKTAPGRWWNTDPRALTEILTQTGAQSVQQLIALGDSLSYTTNRGVTVTLQWVRDGAYTVTVYNGSYRVEDLCGAYADEATARLVARGYAVLYTAEADAADAAEVLRVDITDELAKAMRRRDTKRVATLNRLADRVLDTPADRALAADITNHLGQIADGEKPGPARSLRELRDRHAAAVQRDRKPAA
jgi:hypothetical protein